jgi:hypothetical protein
MFLWQACNNILPTKANLFNKKITSDPLCLICGLEVETVGHALWSYSAARDVWLERNKKIHKRMSNEDAFVNIFEQLLDRLEEVDIELAACIARHIWLRRNKKVFEGEFLPPRQLIQRATEQLKDAMKANHGTQCGGEEHKVQP